MNINELKKVQDAIYQRLVSGGVNISREELSVDGQTLDQCRNAADRMVTAMEAQNDFNNKYADVTVKLDAGLAIDEQTKKEYNEGLKDCKQAVKDYSEAHILAHRTEYAAQLAAYRAANSTTLKKLAEFRYDRDAVDTVIATEATREWKGKHPEIQGKNCLLVGKNAIEDGIDQLIDSNTHSPIPIKDTVSAKVRVPYGEPMYPMLNPAVTQDNNDLRPVNYVPEESKQVVAEQAATQPQMAAQPEIKRFTREYNDEPSDYRKRTFLAADMIFEEKVKRGIKLSPDPAADKQKSKAMDIGTQGLDGILKLNTDNNNNNSNSNG